MKVLGHRLTIGAWIGLIIVAVNLLGAILAPVIAPHGEADLVGDVWAPPSADAASPERNQAYQPPGSREIDSRMYEEISVSA